MGSTLVNPGAANTVRADVAVTKGGPPGPVPAGQSLSYTVTLTNNGPDPAMNAAFSDPTPPNTTFVSTMQNTGPSFTCANPGVGGVGLVHCDTAALASGQSASF